MVDLLERHLPLVLGAESGPARYGTGAYGFWRAHVRVLLREAGVTEPDAMIEPLLAPLAPDVYRYQREQLGYGPEKITEGLRWLAQRLDTTMGHAHLHHPP